MSNCLGINLWENGSTTVGNFFYQSLTQVLQYPKFTSRLHLTRTTICFCWCLTCTHETPDPLILVSIYCFYPDFVFVFLSLTVCPTDFLLARPRSEHVWLKSALWALLNSCVLSRKLLLCRNDTQNDQTFKFRWLIADIVIPVIFSNHCSSLLS